MKSLNNQPANEKTTILLKKEAKMGNTIIELKNISKNFGEQQVLRGIDLNIYENEFLTLLGPSGCGKTTILRIIGGFEEPSNGQVLVSGKDISKIPPYKREINTVFQKYALFPFLNVYDNIAFGLNLKKTDKNIIDKKVKRMLELVGLKGYEKRDVTSLSGGQQQRVAIARAIAKDVDLILADEPTGNLDEKNSREILKAFIELAHNNNKCVIIVTHSPSLAKKCDVQLKINDGQIVEI